MPFTRAAALRLGAGAAFAFAARPASAQALTPLRLAAAADDDITPILYGQSSGIFKSAGLDVQLQALGSGSATAAAVAAGAIDIGKSSLTALISAHARGIPFEIIAPASMYTDAWPVAGFIVGRDSLITGPRDLNGKTVSASSLKDLISLATQAWIDQGGGDSKTVHFIEIPASAVGAALAQKRIDGATVITPGLAEAIDSGAARLIGRSFSAIAKHFMIAGWFTTSDYIAKHGDIVHRFVGAFRRAAAYTDSHRTETVALLAGYSHIAPETIRRMARSTAGTVVDPKDIQPVIDAALKYKIIDKPFPAHELIATLPAGT
jgi:NitT/TauT family transport system substrate-binding protein